MRKRIAAMAALVGATAVVLGLPTVASTAAPDVRGPKCADIRLLADYTGTLGGTATVSGTLLTPSAPSCNGAVYTVYVGTESATFTGDGSTDSWTFSFTVNDAPSTICIYATSQLSANAIAADTAPNTACSDPSTYLILNGGGGASGFG